MKTAIDNNGFEVQVSDDTVVKSINGIHYLLTLEDEAEMAAREAEWQASANNRALTTLRQQRNALITACDYTVLPDSPFTTGEKTVWEAYRQALRDLPETYATNAAEVIWPTVPEGI